jgi:hypothetical protein
VKEMPLDTVNNHVQEMAASFREECDEAVKALVEIAGIETEGKHPTMVMARLKANGFSIKRFSHQPLENFFVLSLKKEFVAGAVVELNFDLNTIKRTMIPHYNELDEKFYKFIKGVE